MIAIKRGAKSAEKQFLLTRKPDLDNASGGILIMLGLISFVAIFTSIVSLIPQLYKTYKSRSAEDLSMCMLINFFICSLSWIAYGVITESLSVWLSNLIMIIFSALLIFFKIKFKKIKG